MEPAGDLERRLSAALLEVDGVGVVSAYLFGSHAAGRPHRESDVDVGVLFDRRALPDPGIVSRRAFSFLAAPVVLGTSAVDLVVLNDAPPGLGPHVVGGGRRLICVDADADHAFVRDVQLRAADLEPFLRRTRRLKLQALAR